MASEERGEEKKCEEQAEEKVVQAGSCGCGMTVKK